MKTKRWIDLSAQQMYLGSITAADGVKRLCLVDVENKADPDALRGIGFLPFEGSARFERGIFYLTGDQALKPSLLAAALGIEKCPVVEVDEAEIDAVFRGVVLAKFEANVNAATRKAEVLGVNADGRFVYIGATGRFVRQSPSEVIAENSAAGNALPHTSFLRVKDPADVGVCAEGFIKPMLSGSKAKWDDVVDFAGVLYGRHATDLELHALQEGIEAAAFRAFSQLHSAADEATFKAATQLYYGLPKARMRTAESVALNQLSTPLPMAVVSQRLLTGLDDVAGKTVLEPTVGNGSLVNLLPEQMLSFGLEIDEKRVAAATGMAGLTVRQGDATTSPLRGVFGQPDGFDYTIANPPFSGLEGVHSFDKLKNIRRMDYLIGLRTLEARKDNGRSILIFGADSKYSSGEVEGSARAFFHYVYDHYDVRACTEIDGRLYSRQGSSYNVRMMVIGDRLATPREASVPEKLNILTSYDELWNWSDSVLAAYAQQAADVVPPAQAAVEDLPVSPGFTRLENGTVVANRTLWLPDLSVRDLESRIGKEQGDEGDVERLKDYKWLLLFDQQSADDKGFMERYMADGGPVLVPRRKFWLTDIEDRIIAFGGNPQDLTNNEAIAREQVVVAAGDSVAVAPEPVVEEKPVPVIGDAVLVRGGAYANTIRKLLGTVKHGSMEFYVVSDSLRGSVTVPGVEFHRHMDVERDPAVASVGQRVRFTAHDAGNELSVGEFEGIVFDVATTQAGNWRYRISTDKVAPQGGGNIEKLVYSNQGSIDVIPAAELDADGLSVAITDVAPLDVPANWLVLNAPRPLLGTRTMENGVFLNGSLYGAIDPADSMAARYLSHNGKQSASVVLIASREEQVAMALSGSEYRQAYYEEMSAEERLSAASGLIADLNKLTYGAAKALLARARVEMLEFSDAAVVEDQAPAASGEPTATAENEAGSAGRSTRRRKDPAPKEEPAALAEPQIDAVDIGDLADIADIGAPGFVTEENSPAVVVASVPGPVVERNVNAFQTPYQPASVMGEPSSMIPINMAGATYAALNALQARVGGIDDYVAGKLQYSKDELAAYFSPEQIDALALGIGALDAGRGMINADETGLGKGRFVAGMMRYVKLQGKRPHFVTIKPELFTDIFRDISDIGSRDLFKKLFIFNTGVHVMQFGTADTVLYKGTNTQEMQAAFEREGVEEDVDMVLATYSQFQKAGHKNKKAQLLSRISDGSAVLFLDESHVASGASNIAATVGEAVANSGGVIYASATPLKGVSNFSIYNKVFPKSVNLKDLPDTLRAGGEALQEAISANMARDGVLVRREHDFSKLTFITRLPNDAMQARNRELSDQLAQILSVMSFMAGDVAKLVGKLNKGYDAEWEEIPEKDRSGGRMHASSMNFGSRLYAINRQFLMGIKIEESIATALEDLEAGRKPVFAVENTGESLLRQVLARRAGIGDLEKEFDELDARTGTLTEAEQLRRMALHEQIGASLRNVRLDSPPQFRELLEIMVERIGQIKEVGRYGDVSTRTPTSEQYGEAVKRVLGLIEKLPELPLTPLDVIKAELGRRHFPITEVSGRTSSLSYDASGWTPQFHPKADAVANVAGFQNGKYDCIIITRSGSTGISLHATNRFADSDTRQRNFIVIQKAANIAEFLQWLGRVNRKDQVVPPIITSLDSGLPAELRLTMMHNTKLRKLSANTTSNRENSKSSGEDFDLLNDVGDEVALNWLFENPDVARSLDIDLPKDDDVLSRFSQDNVYINKLLGRLMMVDVETQEHILNSVSRRFADRVAELEQRGENPFKVHVFEWGAKVVKTEELQSGVLHPTDSTFDEAVKLVSLEYEQEVKPIRGERLIRMIEQGVKWYEDAGPLDANGTLEKYKRGLRSHAEAALRKQLPMKLQDKQESVSQIIATNDAPLAKKAQEKQEFLFANIEYFKPGAFVVYDDIFKGRQEGFVTMVDFPRERDELFLLSKYTMRVVSAGAEEYKEVSLATLFNQEQSLRATQHRCIDPAKTAKPGYLKDRMDRELSPYDAAPAGMITRRAHVLQGNLFRACELASQQQIGSPILFSDAEGNRQRAVLLRSSISPEMVREMPVGLDARDICDYIDEYLRPDHKEHRTRASYRSLCIYDEGIKEMKMGEGLMFEVLNGGRSFRFSMPGAKSRTGRLMTDGNIFDIGKEKTSEHGLKLKLSGTARTAMTVDVSRDVMPELLRRLQAGGYIGKFYIPTPNQETLKALKDKYAHEQGNKLSDDHGYSV